MFSQCVSRIRYGVFVLAMPLLVQAAPAPSQDFWEYMNDFSDADGEVLDPVEVDQMLSLKEAHSDDIDAGAEQEKIPTQARPVTGAKAMDASFPVKKLSGQSSSSVMSGAKL